MTELETTVSFLKMNLKKKHASGGSGGGNEDG